MDSALQRSRDVCAEADLDQFLLSSEKLQDRTSPDLWPEQVPGVSEFGARRHPKELAKPPNWMLDLQKGDIERVDELSQMRLTELLEHVKRLQTRAFELGEAEGREMTRGKFLNVLGKSKETCDQRTAARI